MKQLSERDLPDLFTFNDGTRFTDAADWPRRRAELLDAVMQIEYGPMPPAPAATHGERLHSIQVSRLEGIPLSQYRIETDDPAGSVNFRMDLYGTGQDGPRPVIIDGDACWRYLHDDIIRLVRDAGFLLAEFSRVELVPDIGPVSRERGLHKLYGDAFGSLAAWAWGYHRCVDFLTSLDIVDTSRIAVVGHSRGGKTSLLAGATDERIALVSANNSGCGGAGCFRYLGPEAQDLQDILARFPDWFAREAAGYVGREAELPFDQHFVKAAVAPRLLLTTEALGDPGANPPGAWHTHAAARELFRMLGVENHIGIHYRPGPHAHRIDDWQTLIHFARRHWYGETPAWSFNDCPFTVA